MSDGPGPGSGFPESQVGMGFQAMPAVTIPGTSYFIPNEEPELVAGLLLEALGQTG